MFAAFVSSPLCETTAFANLPTDYCLQTDVEITYTGGGVSTNQPARWIFDTQSFIAETGMNEQAWDIRAVIGSFSNEVFLNVQDINQSDSTVWAILPSIANNTTQTVTKYTGTNNLFRDQGVYFSGGEKLVITDDNILDTSGVGNLQIDLWMDINNETPRDEIILDKRDASNGYEIQFADIASTLNFQFEINTGSCNVLWNTAWANEHNKFTFVYANSTAGTDTFIYVNDSLVGSCDLDEGQVGNNILDLVIGEDSFDGSDPFEGAALKTVTVFDNDTRILKFTFDAIDMSETKDTNPFEGTIVDHSGNGFNAVYEFDRDQSDISVLVKSSQLVNVVAGNQVSQDVSPIDVLGDIVPFDPGFSDKTTDTFIYIWFVEPLEGIGSADWMGVTLAMTGIGIVIGMAFFIATERQFTPLAVFVSGMPISLSGAGGWTPWWYIFMWWAITVFSWWGLRRAQESS